MLGQWSANIQRMAAFFSERPCKLRPHFKAHKTPAIARRQLAAGSAPAHLRHRERSEIMAAEGVSADILMPMRCWEPEKRAGKRGWRPASTSRSPADSATAVSELADAARAAAVQIGVLVDVNVGLPRCGIAPGETSAGLARQGGLQRGAAAPRPHGI